MRARVALGLAAVSLLMTFPATAAEWQLIRGNERAKLSIDTASIQRNGDEAAFQFLVDLREPEGSGDPKEGPPHRSAVTQAKVRCKARTIAIGDAEGFIQNGGNGPAISRTPPQKGEAVFQPLEKGSSDEDLWGYVCAPKGAEPKKK